MSEQGTDPNPTKDERGPRRGRLSIVGTPLGNLGDITYRAVETLKKADRILAEDTRHSRNLLTHLGIGGKPMVFPSRPMCLSSDSRTCSTISNTVNGSRWSPTRECPR
ncbi:MAG: SAM-dependent methyltransferase [Polyangiaceae bacterium]